MANFVSKLPIFLLPWQQGSVSKKLFSAPYRRSYIPNLVKICP